MPGISRLYTQLLLKVLLQQRQSDFMCRSNKLVDELLESEPSRGSINRRSIGVLQFIDGGPQGNFIVAAELVDNGENFLRLRAKVNNALDILDYRALQGANDLRVKIYGNRLWLYSGIGSSH